MADLVIRSLAHLPQARALAIVMSWMAVDELEAASRTICRGGEPPPEA